VRAWWGAGLLGVTAVVAAACGATTSASSTTTGVTTTIPTAAVAPRDVIAAPVQVAVTALGAVGYRRLGAGPPLVLVMGLGGSIDDWTPSFVADLASHFDVVVFDNAGVGRSAGPTGTLTVSAMADQTSALITTLGLGRVDVLGWSMGGMVAQALAVRHPGQVAKIILAATQPGTGKAAPIPAAAGADAASANPAAVLSVLFPASAAAAEHAYVDAIVRYPSFYVAPRSTVDLQVQAVEQWIAGDDPDGARFGSVRFPTLVADGAEDALNPSANAHLLAAAMPGARVVLYPGAGHGFLFQDAASFVPTVEHFLG